MKKAPKKKKRPSGAAALAKLKREDFTPLSPEQMGKSLRAAVKKDGK